MDEKESYELSQATKAKLKIYGFSTGLLALLLVGSVIANIMVYNYIYQQVDQVSCQILLLFLLYFVLNVNLLKLNCDFLVVNC